MRVLVQDGNITDVPADALITTVSSAQSRNGAVDRAIRQVAGGYFHDQVPVEHTKGCFSGQTLWAPNPPALRLPFDGVLFVIDNLDLPLREIVRCALQGAVQNGRYTIAMPLMRTGQAAGRVQEPSGSALSEMALALRLFRSGYQRHAISDATVVVYDSPKLAQTMREMLAAGEV